MSRRTVRGTAGLAVAVLLLATMAPTAGARTGPPRAAGAGTVAPASVLPSVNLGAYALNGPVRAAVIDPATGNTYLGGTFTRIGRRTGGVAVVDAPGVSTGDLRAGSPEVLGNVQAVFGDDRPNDPGFFVVGRLSAINGSAVPRNQPVHRIHLVDGAWVRDTSWSVTGECNVGNIKFPMEMEWIATDTYLIGGSQAGADSWMGSITGIVVINRTTGVLRSLGASLCSVDALLPSIPNLPLLADCKGQDYCVAVVDRMAWDPTSKRLVVAYSYIKGPAATAASNAGLAAYDLAAGGGRTWLRSLYAGSFGDPARSASPGQLSAVPNAFVASGRFPLAGATTDAEVTRRVLVDASTGAILRRWNSQGEQDPGDGSTTGPATSCLTELDPFRAIPARVGAESYRWTVDRLCHDRWDGGAFVSDTVPGIPDWAGEHLAPSTPYTASDGTLYLLGSHAAVDVTHGTLATWNPDPAMTAGAQRPSVTVAGGVAIVGGDFRFVRGTDMPAIAALDPSLAPLAGFASHLPAPVYTGDGIEDLALTEGTLLAGGQAIGGSTLLGMDPASGAVTWTPPDSALQAVDAIAVGPDGTIWAGGMTDIAEPGHALRRYARLADGASPIATPAFGCIAGTQSSYPTCEPEWSGRTRVTAVDVEPDGTVYLGGAFGSVGGVTRRSLARLAPDGSLSSWNPDLIASLRIDPTTYHEAVPFAFAVLGDNVVVGGSFQWERAYDDGNTTNRPVPLLVYSAATGALLRPSGSGLESWYDIGGWNPIGYDLLATDGGLVAALGEPGMGIFDATTLELDSTSSGPYFDPDWLTPIVGNEVLALAIPPAPPAAPVAASASVRIAAASTPLVVGGTIQRWKNRVAGNVLRTGITPDTTPPTVSDIRVTPSGRVASGSAAGVRVSWTAADPHGSGASSYEVWRSISGGAWQKIATGIHRRLLDVPVAAGRDYRFRVRATDNAGNTGPITAGPTIRVALRKQRGVGTSFTGTWVRDTSAAYLGGSVVRARVHGASATVRFTGRAIGVITTLAPTRGRVRIYVDGRYVRTVDLRAGSASYRRVGFARSWSATGTHTVRLVVSGTSGRPRIDVDGWMIVR